MIFIKISLIFAKIHLISMAVAEGGVGGKFGGKSLQQRMTPYKNDTGIADLADGFSFATGRGPWCIPAFPTLSPVATATWIRLNLAKIRLIS